jgi:anti-sigma factor RsiW
MKEKNSREKCLSDDEVASYVDGVARPDERKRIEDHLVRCSFCLHNVAELKQLLLPETELAAGMPAEALARAESIIARHTQTLPEFDVTLALKNGICKLLETTGNLLLPGRFAPVAVRGEKQAGPNLRIAKSLSGYLVTLEFAAGKQEAVPKLTIVEEASSAKPDGIKAKLYSPGASETKYSRQGKMSFSALKPGVYGIEIEEVGKIRLDIQ